MVFFWSRPKVWSWSSQSFRATAKSLFWCEPCLYLKQLRGFCRRYKMSKVSNMELQILSMVFRQMYLQIICLQWGIVTFTAFVWLFSTVRFKMCSQIACLWGCIVTLVAFVWLFSTVRFQMCPQMVCLRRCKITLVAFVQLLSIVRFQMSPQHVCTRRCIVTLVAFV